MGAMERRPAVAGSFYEADPARLREQVKRCFEQARTDAPSRRKSTFLGAVVPHAGLMYSGHVAAAVYDAMDLPRRLIILCPNHSGTGAAVAIDARGGWRTPLGTVPIDEALASELQAESTVFEEDSVAHAREHSLEVQLPLLQYLTAFTFVPICMRTPNLALCEEVGGAIARVVQRHSEMGEQIGILASSDMNHYQDQQTTLRKDQRAIDEILSLDPRSLWKVVLGEDISMCGFIPTTAMLIAVNLLGARDASLIRHATSGDVNGDYGHVVGYAGILIS